MTSLVVSKGFCPFPHHFRILWNGIKESAYLPHFPGRVKVEVRPRVRGGWRALWEVAD